MRLAFPRLSAVLREGSTVCTPTPLLAAIANEQFDRQQIADGKSAWERPKVTSLDVWMTTCWQEARFTRLNVPTLLSPVQERELWRRIIEADRPDLFDPASMARLARRSAGTLAEYQIPWEPEDWTEHEDARQFQIWLRKLRDACAHNDWMIRSDLWRVMPDWASGTVVFPALNYVSPGLKKIAAVAGSVAGSTHSFRPAKAEAMCFSSFTAEVEYGAHAARELVEKGETSIAVFIPELARHASLLQRTFDSVFYPAGPLETSAFHLSTHAVADEPLIAGALLFLELIKPRIDHAVAGAILRSPFLAGAQAELSPRALADVKLRKTRELDVTLGDIEAATHGCPQFKAILTSVRVVLKNSIWQQSPSGWSRLFTNLLTACGWPGREVGPRERELVDTWKRALSDLSSLALITPAMDLNVALSRLRGLLAQPAQVGDWSSPVQILDSTSAQGTEFDHTLIPGLSEEFFLRAPLLSPLIPFRLQRRHQVPGSGERGAAEWRDDAAAALFYSAPNVRATFSAGLPAIAKPFVKKVTTRVPESHPPLQPAALQEIEDGTAPPLAPIDVMRGGARVIQAQSQCPFKAFAEYRLSAKPPEDACFGYDARDRGNFTHKALELVWKQLGSQQKLKAMEREELRATVQAVVADALARDTPPGPLQLQSTLVEQERLERVVLEWLDVERERQQPFTVQHIEEKRYYEAPGLRLELRVDRIDKLADGSMLLIDYKTGVMTKTKLEGERPKEPQLLVYAAVSKEPVDALLFGAVGGVEPRLVGHARSKHTKGNSIKGHPNDWDEFVAGGNETVAKLAGEFVAGIADVRPSDASACGYCAAKPLCRISELAQLDEDED